MVSAQSIYTGIAIGRTLAVSEPNTSKAVGGMSVIQAISPYLQSIG